MADFLFYPQLVSGCLVQYPFSKSFHGRVVRNVMSDGRLIVMPDPLSRMLRWQLNYTELEGPDADALISFYRACNGSLRSFGFIDPVGNMLTSSGDLSAQIWQRPPALRLEGGLLAPDGSVSAVRATNTLSSDCALSQVLQVPADYQCCFSGYFKSTTGVQVTLSLTGSSQSDETTSVVGANWTRLVRSSRLQDAGKTLTVSVSIPAGQQVEIYGLQLEAQPSPSAYRPTFASGAVYYNAHWCSGELQVSADAPGLFSVQANLEVRG